MLQKANSQLWPSVGLGDEAVRNTELGLYQHFSGGERAISVLLAHDLEVFSFILYPSVPTQARSELPAPRLIISYLRF